MKEQSRYTEGGYRKRQLTLPGRANKALGKMAFE